MAIYDVDPFYASKFAEYANRNEKTPFMAVAFTSMGRLQAFVSQQQIDLLLVGDEVTTQELAGISVGQIVRLSESGIGDGPGPVVYKFQPSDQVLREVMSSYQVEVEPEVCMTMGRKCTVIGVYSPIQRCGKTGFAITMGQILGKEEGVLYISLEAHSGLERWMGVEHKKSLSDLLYYFRQGQYSGLRLSAVIHSFHQLAYIPPVTYGEDLDGMEGKELCSLMAEIEADPRYNVIILDLGNFSRGVESLMERCTVLYVPTKEDGISTAKLEAWKQYLERSQRGHLWERVQLIKLPNQEHTGLPEQYLEQLLWGAVGDYARGLLKGQKTEWKH